MKLFLKLFFILLLAVAGYTAFMSYSPILKGTVVVITEKSTGNVISLITKEQPFVFFRALPWFYSVKTENLEFPITLNAHIDIPSLLELDHDSFGITIPLKADVKIVPNELKNPNILKGSPEQLKEYIANEITFAFASLAQSYLLPVYQYGQILANKDGMLSSVSASIEERFKQEGLLISNLGYTGTLLLPDMRLYEEGLAYLRTQRNISLENQKKILELSGQLEREALVKQKLYQSYIEISDIIKENPDILKYIYIDKMAGNLKVIISSDKTGLPAFLESYKDKEDGDSVTNKAKIKEKDMETDLQS